MAFKLVSSFEVLSQPIAPGLQNVPYVQQGYFIQVTNLGGAAIKPTIEYVSTPAFTASVASPVKSPFGPVPAAISLFADLIDQTGTPLAYSVPANFLPGVAGFKGATLPAAIPPQGSFLFGVQYILNTSNATFTTGSGATPQDTVEGRGYARIEAPAGSKILVLATIRQLFSNYGPNNTLLDFADGAYTPPLVDGPLLSF